MLNYFYIISVYLLDSQITVSLEHVMRMNTVAEKTNVAKKTVEVWYFWAAVLLIVIAIFVAICLYIGRKKRHKYSTYNLLTEEREPVL
ncbi:hypothetical protein NQ314_007251 [Rhamnusium bicolor]|uniref:Uncharacterized protein n=1 Tax=Rhamnusium bicolor TaxID=1586634 RepID=A0AAV8YRW3_9CUCU|nr:hypothetical protein NQ314_007251 [Rhamnusium bicolor]